MNNNHDIDNNDTEDNRDNSVVGNRMLNGNENIVNHNYNNVINYVIIEYIRMNNKNV